MKKPNLIQLTILFFLAVSFASCEGNTDWTWNIENDSSGTIEVKALMQNNYLDSMYSIPTWGSSEIAMTSNRGGNENSGSPTSRIIELLIINEDGDTLKKDTKLNENWSVISNERKKIPSMWEHDFYFFVYDVDFE